MKNLLVLLGAILGSGSLLVGVLCLNESVTDPPAVKGWAAAFQAPPRDRSSYAPGLGLTIGGSALLGFALGRGRRPAPRSEIQILESESTWNRS
jgi:hypothetical protein